MIFLEVSILHPFQLSDKYPLNYPQDIAFTMLALGISTKKPAEVVYRSLKSIITIKTICRCYFKINCTYAHFEGSNLIR